ncbi:EAL domain-containing protein [Microvirga sp. CF3062]|uniref:putative bifunctional diguanylate cyclase/phosphodiesterase n=1 Tax=Microvirga sp. CF3062 TaxID=3110182 RepID=UPI002E75BBC5|nr:EAL domain-containing protein [Microvirga sp. CF3062]MEE1656169.1 EAL domain-containing protein [Microvirga sp. CF3062]
MLSHFLSFDRAERPFIRGVLLPVVLVAFTTLAMGAGAILWAVDRSNDISAERQLRTTEASIRAAVQELAQQQEMVAIWDDAVVELSKRSLDLKWVDANFGVWLNKTFGQDEIYILDDRNEPLVATVGATRVPTEEYERVRANVRDIVAGVRGVPGSLHRAHVADLATASYLKTGQAVHDAHLLELNGRPVAVSVMKIIPESEDVPYPHGREFLLLSVRFLDGSFITQLSEQNLIDGLRFSSTDTPQLGEVSVPVRSDVGHLIGYFIWNPELPGDRVLRSVGPIMAAAAAMILLLLSALVRRLRQSTRALERTVLELKASEAQAHHLAFHDVLTGLPNRAMFEDRLTHATARMQNGEQVAVMMIDLDRFKHVNDTLGHHAGDSLIQEFAIRLSTLVNGEVTITRLGGDEFAIVQIFKSGTDAPQALCDRILAASVQPYDVLGNQVFVGASIGLVLAPEAGLDRIELLRKADIALYRAKGEGRNCYRLFTPEMDETINVSRAIEEDLRAALATGEGLEVAYQPQISQGGSVVGVEALARWHHPTRGCIQPSQFIPVAEQTGLIVPLGEWILRQACTASRRWPDLFVSVNLSPVQFRSCDFADRLIAIVRECGGHPQRIELEVTEGVLLEEDGRTNDALQRLREAGFRIALDDFGTGYSSLGYLHRFEVDKIKIDRSFTQSLGQGGKAATVIKAIVALGHAMSITVTAEGVETEIQRSFLDTAGCNEMQGFLFSKAIPEEQITQLLSRSLAKQDQIYVNSAPILRTG